MTTRQIVLLLIPLVAIDLVLVVVAVVDWSHRRSYRFLPRIVWLLVILFVSTLGAVVYLAVGRGEIEADRDPGGTT